MNAVAGGRAYYAEKGLSAVYYDLITAHDQSLAGDIDLYASLAPPGGEVLELGAGTGRVALALAQRGLDVVGVDLAPAMLAQARAKRARLDPAGELAVEFRLGDMTALDLPRQFDLVICPFFGLAHLPAGAAWRNAFAVAARRLKPGGQAAFHLPLRAGMAGLPPPDPKRPVARLPIGETGRQLVLYVTERRFREPPGRFDQVTDYVVADAGGATLQRSSERLTYYAADPAPFAAAAGLVPQGEPMALGGAGAVHLFRRA